MRAAVVCADGRVTSAGAASAAVNCSASAELDEKHRFCRELRLHLTDMINCCEKMLVIIIYTVVVLTAMTAILIYLVYAINSIN